MRSEHGLRTSHHLLELLEIDATIAVGVDGADHSRAILEGDLLAQALEHRVQLTRGYQAVLVAIVHVEGVTELRKASVAVGSAVEVGELLEVNEAVTVGVDLRHYARKLVRRRGGAECLEHLAELFG